MSLSEHFLNYYYLLLQTIFDGRFYEIKITAGPKYPDVPPTLRFVTKINLSCVNQANGIVLSDLQGII